MILKDRAARWNADKEIQALVRDLGKSQGSLPGTTEYSSKGGETLLAHAFDRVGIAAKGLGYERLDQLTVEVLLGVRG